MLMNYEIALCPVLLVSGVLLLVLPWVPATSRLARRTLFWAFLVMQGIYFAWRITSTLPDSPGTLTYSLLVLALELLNAFAGYRSMGGLLSPGDRTQETNAHMGWYAGSGEPPLVDILITTYNESWSILEKTLVGALAQDYPRFRIWLLDDGRRDWLSIEAQSMGVGYVTRSDNRFAKAGNLNNGLQYLLTLDQPPDFVAVLDADFIPRRNFLSRAMALMHNPKVGIVQTPQYHFNPDPFQTAFNGWEHWPDVQRFIFSTVLPGRDGDGAAYCCGTSFLARATALKEIGGFPTESITEDVLTTMKMRRKGWSTVYLQELLSTGMAPEGVHEYLTQRGRWCLGGVQIGWWLWKQDAQRRTLWQRVLAFDWFVSWGYTSLIRVLFLTFPIVFWLFGVAPLSTTSWEMVFFSFPALILQRMFLTWLSRGTQLPILNQAYGILGSFAVIPAMFKGLFDRKSHRFAVTDKGVNHAGVIIHWGVFKWLLGYQLLLVGSIAYHFTLGGASGRDTAFVGITCVWSALNLLLVFVSAAPCIEEPRRRQEQRYDSGKERADIRMGAVLIPATVHDISVSGILLATSVPLRVGEQVRVEVAGVGEVTARIARQAGHGLWGAAFETTNEQRRALIAKIFVSEGYVKPATTGRVDVLAAAILRKLVA